MLQIMKHPIFLGRMVCEAREIRDCSVVRVPAPFGPFDSFLFRKVRMRRSLIVRGGTKRTPNRVLLSGFGIKSILLLDWLPTEARKHKLPCYFIHSKRKTGEFRIYMIPTRTNCDMRSVFEWYHTSL